MRTLILSAGALLWASSALAAQPVTVQGANGQQATVTGGALSVSTSNMPTTVSTNAGAVDAGTLRMTPGDSTAVSTSALATALVVNNAASSLRSFSVNADATLSAAAWYVLIMNATTDTGNGAVTPIKCYAVPAGYPNISGAFPNPIRMGTGIVIVASTTGCFTETQSAHAYISGDYK